MDHTDEYKRQDARYRIVDAAGELFHADLHVAELSGVEGFVKLFTLWKVHPRLCEAGAVKLLLEDLNLVSKLSVWSISQVMDIWWSSSAITFSTEYVKGTTLAGARDVAAGRGERLPYTAVLATILEVAHALEHAHEPLQGAEPVVHGDLRPEHVLITKDGEVKLTGFGFARFLPMASPDGQWLTWGGRCYQPPERLRPGPVDPRLDIHALGAMLLEGVSGQLPYGTDDPARLQSLLRSGNSALPAGSLEIPGDLLEVIARACSPRPDDRYSSVSDMAVDLHRLLLEQIRANPDTPRVKAILEVAESPAPADQQAPAPVLETNPGSSVQAFPQLVRPTTPLVGRGDALLRVGRALASAAQGKGRAVLLQGEPGMGRTRLLTEVALRLSKSDRKLAWIHVEPLPEEQGVAYSAMLRLLASAMGLGPHSALIRVAEEADRLRAFGLDDQQLAVVCAAAGVVPEGPPPEPARIAGLLGQALRRCVTSLSWERTTVVACDDFQWIDDASAACLVELLEGIDAVPAVVLLAATPGVAQLARNSGKVDTIELGPLSPKRCEELALALVPEAQNVDSDLLEALVDRSDGTPLLLEEIIDLLLEAGRLEIASGTLHLSGGLENPLPMLEEAVRLRISSLFPEVATVAVAAALAGPAMNPEIIAAATELTPEVVQQALDDLAQQHRVLRQAPAGLSFPHERLRGAVLASSDPQLVERLRRSLAQAILAHRSEPSCAMADHAARLLARSGQLAEAVEQLSRTAARQLQRGDPGGAARRYSEALQLVGSMEVQDPRAELELCLDTGRASLNSLSLDIGEQALQRAVELADQAGDARSSAEARILMCRMQARKGVLTAARAWAVQAVPEAERSGDRSLLAQAYAAIAETLQQYGEYGPDWAYIEAALAIAHEQDEHLRLGQYLQLAVMHAGGVGLYDQTSDYLEQARAIAEEVNDPMLSAQLRKSEALLLLFIGDAEAALGVNLEGIRHARRHGLLEVEIVMLHNAGDDHLFLGNMREALYYFTESLRRSQEAKLDRLTEANEMFIGFIEAAYLGSPRGFQRLEAAIETGRRLERVWNLTQGHQLMGRALLSQDDPGGAVKHLEEAVRLARKTGVKFFIDEAGRWLARATRQVSNPASTDGGRP